MTMTAAMPGPAKLMIAAAFAALCFFLFPAQARANVTCGVTSQGITFGSASAATGTVSYSCVNYNSVNTTPVQITLCIGIGTPSYPGSTSQPVMVNGSSNLNFNLYTTASHSTVWTTSTPISTPITIASSGNGSGVTKTGSISFYGSIPSGQGAPAGAYSAHFYSSTLGVLSGNSCQSSGGSGISATTGQQFTIDINTTVGNNCSVTAAGPADLGTVRPTATNLTGSTTISVNCPSGTAYTIGLAPSNGNTSGAGVLKGTGSNTDKPPYQLRSTSGTGPIWGNTATATNAGNGVAGTGTGSPQSFPVYVSMPSANFVPDTYADTVTVNLNF